MFSKCPKVAWEAFAKKYRRNCIQHVQVSSFFKMPRILISPETHVAPKMGPPGVVHYGFCVCNLCSLHNQVISHGYPLAVFRLYRF